MSCRDVRSGLRLFGFRWIFSVFYGMRRARWGSGLESAQDDDVFVLWKVALLFGWVALLLALGGERERGVFGWCIWNFRIVRGGYFRRERFNVYSLLVFLGANCAVQFGSHLGDKTVFHTSRGESDWRLVSHDSALWAFTLSGLLVSHGVTAQRGGQHHRFNCFFRSDHGQLGGHLWRWGRLLPKSECFPSKWHVGMLLRCHHSQKRFCSYFGLTKLWNLDLLDHLLRKLQYREENGFIGR